MIEKENQISKKYTSIKDLLDSIYTLIETTPDHSRHYHVTMNDKELALFKTHVGNTTILSEHMPNIYYGPNAISIEIIKNNIMEKDSLEKQLKDGQSAADSLREYHFTPNAEKDHIGALSPNTPKPNIKKAISKPSKVRYITFEDFVKYGALIDPEGAKRHNGFSWSFYFEGHLVTHENDKCYIVPTNHGPVLFTPDNILIISDDIYPINKPLFDKKYADV